MLMRHMDSHTINAYRDAHVPSGSNGLTDLIITAPLILIISYVF